jgi:hypothetical protein
LALTIGLSGCGSSIPSLLQGDGGDPPKVSCPGDHDGFFVCMSANSSISDKSLEQAIVQGLTDLATLVNTASFQRQVDTGFGEGPSINGALQTTNYIVTITGYCDASSTTLAQAVVGGSTIQYNECTVQKTSSGQIDQAAVSGVLLHEISHNVGYTHPSVNPSRLTVPYWLGDTATDDFDAQAGISTDTGSGTGTGTGTETGHHGRTFTWGD